MKKSTFGIIFSLLLVTFWVSSCTKSPDPDSKKVKIGITCIVEHPFLEDARKGFLDRMTEMGYKAGENVSYDYRNAFGKIENANTIASAFIGNKVDLIYSISTPATQAVKEKTVEIPIVFAAVTDPLAAGLVDSLEKPGNNVTGTTDKIPTQYLLMTIKEIMPLLKKLGVPYNAGEANSASVVKEMKQLSSEYGIQVIETTATNSADVSQAISSLVTKVDAIYMPPDNTMASALNVIADICIKNSIPLFSCESESVKNGEALAALSVNHYELGVEAANMAIQILEKKALPGEIPVRGLKKYDLDINLNRAKKLGLEIPEAVLKEASIIQ